jgi:hypothetical protein
MPVPEPTVQPAGDRRHQIAWTAAGLRRAAATAGVTLPVDFARAVAADGLERTDQLAVSRSGAGVIIHTRPGSTRQLPVLLGYADARGQWHRDGRRHRPAVLPADQAATPDLGPVA